MVKLLLWIKIYGPGPVIAHNSIAYFHDAMDLKLTVLRKVILSEEPPSIRTFTDDMAFGSIDEFIEDRWWVLTFRVFNTRGG